MCQADYWPSTQPPGSELVEEDAATGASLGYKVVMTDIADPDISPQLTVLKERMAKALKGFSNGPPEETSDLGMIAHSPDRALFPVPELVLFGLRTVMGFRWSGPWEKVRWTVYATVDGEPFGFALQKFGFRILARRDVSPKLLARVTGQLSGSLKLLEPLLKIYATAQIAEGNLTLQNRMRMYEDRYRYFRGLADRAFAFEPIEEPVASRKKASDVDLLQAAVARINRKGEADGHGFYASSAMVDAWFSGLEHRMLLLRAFLGRPIANGDFPAFLAAKWDDRFVALFDDGIETSTGTLLGQLRDVKAVIRNPLAHGGVENDGGAFYFHLPRVGAVPANLSRYRGRLKMSFFPIVAGTHEETCQLFDAVDALLTSGPFELANEFVRWGIDPQFDAKSIAEYGEAIAEGGEAVEALVDHLGRLWERHVNMDY